MVAATLDIYNTIADNLLPTPAKSHYTFNLRDLSKVFQVRDSTRVEVFFLVVENKSHFSHKCSLFDTVTHLFLGRACFKEVRISSPRRNSSSACGVTSACVSSMTGL